MSLDLKNDVIFKEFFSRKGNEEYLREFLSSLLKTDIKIISIIRDVSLERVSIEDKLGVLDIQAVVDNKTVVSVEMQMKPFKSMIRRDGFYGAKQLSSEARKGEKYAEFKPIIVVNLLNFNLEELRNCKGYVSRGITVVEEDKESKLDTGISYYFIELPKFRKASPDMNDKLNQWLAFIDNRNRGWIEMSKEKNETIKKAEEELEYLTGEEEVKRIAFLREKWELDYASLMSDAKEDGMEAGRKEGMKEGMKKGIQQGIAKGREEGKKESIKVVARKMKEENMPIEIIMKVTELSKEEIEKL